MSTTVTKSRKFDAEAATKEHYIRLLEMAEMRLKRAEKYAEKLEKLLSEHDVDFDVAEDYPIEEITEPKYSVLYRKAKYEACQHRVEIAKNRIAMLHNAWSAYLQECRNSLLEIASFYTR
jgi:hypothetical protein